MWWVKLVGTVIFVWVIAALLGGLFELAMIDDTDQSLINNVLFYRAVTTEGTWGAIELASGAGGWITSVWKLATFQFSFVTGEAELVRWIVFAPITGMLVIGLVLTVISILRGTV